MVYRRTARSEAVRAASRTRILTAARTLFLERGYDATTMQDIVTAAGTSVGNAYFYFGNKEHVLVELVESAMQQMWEASEEKVASVPLGPARIGTLLYLNAAEALSGERLLARLIFVVEPHPGAATAVRDFALRKWMDALATSFPRLSSVERQTSAAAIFGINRGLVEAALATDQEMPSSTVARTAVRWVLRGLGTPDSEIDTIVRSAARRARARRPVE